MKKIAVIFPGIGYQSDKPLLYYAKKLAKEYEFEIQEVTYGELPQEDIPAALQMAMDTAEKVLNQVLFDTYDCILFISKSIGTAVAGAYEEKIAKRINNIYFTPIAEALSMLHSEGIVFHGTSDTWVRTEDVIATCEQKELQLYITEHANHSMEVGKVLKDIVIQEEIAKECKKYLDAIISRDIK